MLHMRMMRFLTALAALFGMAALSAPAAATDTSFLFTGECADCTGTGTGTLVLQDYTIGDLLSADNFVSFNYSSNLTSFTIDSVNGIVGSLSTLPGANFVSFFNGDYVFSSLAVGGLSAWCTGTAGSCASDFGTSSSWSLAAAGSVPEPAIWAAMVLGFGLLGMTMRRPRNVHLLHA
jgi:hypothetical protein